MGYMGHPHHHGAEDEAEDTTKGWALYDNVLERFVTGVGTKGDCAAAQALLNRQRRAQGLEVAPKGRFSTRRV